ncbi:unnamed protein product [Staurois parvus]|uniref:POU domain protein n=1 Tax=Staurois parvus TaxID=386267 RepID=A0ABN9DLV8_9NEOB|nr:unnamed protein product [Staurois parvus]
MYNQQNFQGFGHNAGLMQDPNYQYNMGGYAGLGQPNNNQSFYSFPTVKSDYVDLGFQGVGDYSAQALPWNQLAQMDSIIQMIIGDDQQGRELMSIAGEVKRNPKNEIDPEPVIKELNQTATLNTQPPNSMGAPYYAPAWNGGTYWPSPTTNMVNKPQASVKPIPAQQYVENQNSAEKSGISSVAKSKRSGSTSPVHIVQKKVTPRRIPYKGILEYFSDLEEEVTTTAEMEQFARDLKHKRITLGFTQADVGYALGLFFGKTFSQTTVCRFESLQLSFKNMCKLKPLLRRWQHEVETNDKIHELLSRGQISPQTQKRKHRTSIENNVKRILENYFVHCSKPGAQEIAHIARELKMDKDVIRVWFCNRRQKGKRQVHPYLRENGRAAYNVVQSLSPSNAGPFAMPQVMATQGFAPTSLGSNPALYAPTFLKSEVYPQGMPHGMAIANHAT